MNHHPGERVHLELRKDTFVLYNDHAKERMELPYADADEVVSQLARVVSSEHYQLAASRPPTRSATGHLLQDTPQKMKPASSRRKLNFVCKCGSVIPADVRRLTINDMGEAMCMICYTEKRRWLYERTPDA